MGEATAAPAGASAREDLDAPVGLGLTVGDIRRGNEALAAEAGPPGDSMAVCERLAAAGLVAHCTNIGHSGLGVVDTTSFELPDAARGRGLINHYGTAQALQTAKGAAKELAVPFIENAPAKILLLGGDGMTGAERERVRAIVER